MNRLCYSSSCVGPLNLEASGQGRQSVFLQSPRHDMVQKKLNCGLNLAITCARNSNSLPWSRYNVHTKYKLIILISFLDSLVSKSSAPSLETALAYVMSLRWVSYLILFLSISCYPAERSRAVTVALGVCITLPREPIAYQWSESSLYWFAGCCCSDWTTEGVCSVLWTFVLQ